MGADVCVCVCARLFFRSVPFLSILPFTFKEREVACEASVQQKRGGWEAFTYIITFRVEGVVKEEGRYDSQVARVFCGREESSW